MPKKFKFKKLSRVRDPFKSVQCVLYNATEQPVTLITQVHL